jgi:glycosyltransferase involved in cell wall biosynthesis
MNILFLSYWGIDEGLSVATVLPHLRILNDMKEVNKVIYCSIERNGKIHAERKLQEKIVHVPFFSGTSYLHKVFDFLFLPEKLIRLAKKHAIDLMICRATPAGALGYKVFKRTGITYAVESFEPHAQYMVESGVWNPAGLKYRAQLKWEKAQLLTAKWIMTVSHNYKDYLAGQCADPDKILAVPCAVEIEKFVFKESSRREIRDSLLFSERSIVGIYTGKFGGLYYDAEAFDLFAKAFQSIADFKLIILTPHKKQPIAGKLVQAGIPENSFFISQVSHDKVADYLSAADFAFATYKPSPSKKYLSPIKIAEYWANGLPVLLTEGIGDDSQIIQEEGGGVTVAMNESCAVSQALNTIENMVRSNSRKELSKKVSKLALKHRNFDKVKKAYELILQQKKTLVF